MRGTRGLLALAAVAAVLAVVLSSPTGLGERDSSAAEIGAATAEAPPVETSSVAYPAPRVVHGGAFAGTATAPGTKAPGLKRPIPPQPCGPQAPLHVEAHMAPLGNNQYRVTALLTPRYNVARELTVEFGLPEGVTPLPGESLTRLCDADPYQASVVTLDVTGPPGLHRVVVHGWEHIGGRNNVSAVATVDVVIQ
jgi:hypothetical protein